MMEQEIRNPVKDETWDAALWFAVWSAAMIVAYMVWGDLGGAAVMLATVSWIFGRVTGENKGRETRR
jgi:hypothetical protein